MNTTIKAAWSGIRGVWVQHRRLLLCLTVPLFVHLAYLLQVMNLGGGSETSERWFLWLASHTSDKQLNSRIRLIYIDEHGNGALGDFDSPRQRQLWRVNHARLLRKLEAARAAVVVFDLSFPSPDAQTAQASNDFAQAIGDVQSRGRTRVVIGYVNNEPTDSTIAAALPLSNWGLVKIRGERSDVAGEQAVSRVLLAIADGRSAGGLNERLAAPHPLPLRILMTWKEGTGKTVTAGVNQDDVVLWADQQIVGRIRTESQWCRRGDRNCEVESEFEWRRQMMLPVVPPLINTEDDEPYESVLARSDLGEAFGGKIVIVGLRNEAEKVHSLARMSENSTLYGYHIVAGVVNDLLNSTYPRRRTAIWELFVLYAAAGVGVMARRLLPAWKVSLPVKWPKEIPLGLAITLVVYVTTVLIVYETYYIIPEAGYDLIVLVAVYYIAGHKQTKKRSRPSNLARRARASG